MKQKRLIGILLSLFLMLAFMPVFAVPAHAAGNVAVNSTNFPDPVFRDYVQYTLNEGSTVLTPETIATIQGINVSGKSISSLQGIEYFTALVTLNCSETQITSLNTGYNANLKTLYCNSCYDLTYLNVSSCTKLETLYCYNGGITNLILTNTPALRDLQCDRNSLTSLNVSGHTNLRYLECYGNRLTSLNVSGCTALMRLWCYNNPLNGLNVSSCTALTNLQCYSCGLNSLDVSANTNLETLNCRNNNLTELDTSNHSSLTRLFVNDNPSLQKLNCSDCAIYELNVSGCPSLSILFCGNNDLTGLTLWQNTALSNLHCYGNQLTSLDVSQNSSLEYLYCHDNELTTLNLPYGSSLKHVYCYNNDLTTLNVANNPELEHLSCYGNRLQQLDVTKNPKLTTLNCGSNLLGSLDLSKNTKVNYLVCSSNQLSSLDVSKLTSLTSLECNNNRLTALDVTKNTKLYYLDCAYNSIDELNITTCSKLVSAYNNGEETDYYPVYIYEYGSYVLRVDQATPVVISNSPILLSSPSNKTVVYGTDAKFTVNVFGSGLHYQWQYSKDGGQTWIDCTSSGYNTATFKFTASPNHDNRLYRCAVSNGYGGLVSNSAKLRVVGITDPPAAQSVAPETKATFTIGASGSPTYQWQYSKDNGATWNDCSSTGYNKATFSFTAKSSMNGRLYRCIVSKGNTIALTSEAAKLTVGSTAKPEISTQPSNKTVASGKTAKFTVTAAGSGLTYQWQYSKDNGSTWNNCSSAGYDTSSFSFSASASMNGRLYRCKVTNSAGSVTSSSAKLTISDVKPAITGQPSAKSVTAGKTAKFTVAAAGSGLTYQWYYSKDNGATWTKCTSAGSDTASFSFTAKASMNGRLYRCKVTNSYGSVTSSSAKLTVK